MPIIVSPGKTGRALKRILSSGKLALHILTGSHPTSCRCLPPDPSIRTVYASLLLFSLSTNGVSGLCQDGLSRPPLLPHFASNSRSEIMYAPANAQIDNTYSNTKVGTG